MLDRLRERRALPVVVLLVVLVLGVGAVALLSGSDDEQPTVRTAPTGQLRGFHYPGWFDDSNRTIERRLDEVRDAGGNVVRVPFAWPVFEPRPRQIDDRALNRFAFLVSAAVKRKIHVIWMLGGTPCEYAEMPGEVLARCVSALRRNRRAAVRNAEFITWPPLDEGAWRNGLRLVLQKVGGGLTAAEVWNEPNERSFFRTEGDRVDAYLELLRWTYDEIKQRLPNLPVLAGAIANADTPFLLELYAKGLRGLSDGVSVHPYSYRPAAGSVATRPGAITFDSDRNRSFLSGLIEMHRIMTAYGEGNHKLWITEFGSRACSARRILCAGSERRQADWATESFVTAARLPFVAAIAMHELIDNDALRFGALTRGDERRPVFDAIKRAQEHLAEQPRAGGAYPLMPGCRPAPFGPCPGRAAPGRGVERRLPRLAHAYQVQLRCGPAASDEVDASGRFVKTDPGLEFTAGCQQPWRPGGPVGDDGQQLLPAADGPPKGKRTATFAFVAPGSRLMADEDGGLPGRAHVVAIETVQALLRANTVNADVTLRTNALAERRRGSDLVAGCRRGAGGVQRSKWRGVRGSRCDTRATPYLTARGVADRFVVPKRRDVREVVWQVSCPGPCDPAGGPFAARIALKRATIMVQESTPPSLDVDFGDGTAKVAVSDLMGVDRVEVRAGRERLATHDTRSCRPSAGKVLRTRVPCPRDADRRVVVDVRVPPVDALRIVARDALGNVVQRTVTVPQ